MEILLLTHDYLFEDSVYGVGICYVVLYGYVCDSVCVGVIFNV